MSNGSESAQQAIWTAGEGPSRPPQPPLSEPVPQPPARFQPVNRQQMVWRGVDVEQLIEADHLARAIWEMTGRLDLTPYTDAVRAVEGSAGRAAIAPRLLIALWIYAYREKVSSAREVERGCAYHPAYQWLTGCEAVNHHTLSDFRLQHQEALDGLFPEARLMKQGDGGHTPSHNVPISTDPAHSIIVGASVTQDANDLGQLVPGVEEVEQQNGRAPGR